MATKNIGNTSNNDNGHIDNHKQETIEKIFWVNVRTGTGIIFAGIGCCMAIASGIISIMKH